MRERIVANAVFWGLVSGVFSAESPQIGSWAMEGMEDSGFCWTFTEQLVIMDDGYSLAQTNHYSIDYSQSPAWLDVGPTNETIRFVIAFDGHDTLKLGISGESPELRPASFDEADAVMVYKRKAVAKKEPVHPLRAMTKGIAFVEPSKQVYDSFVKGETAALNPASLSSFILNAFPKKDALSDYEIFILDAASDPLAKREATLRTHYGSMFRNENIKEVVWNESSEGTAQGHFAFDMADSIGSSGTVLFRAQKRDSGWELYNLAIPKKGSRSWDGAYVIF